MARTASLPGVEDERNPELVGVANKYVLRRDTRMVAGKLESETKDILITMMKESGITSFHDPDSDLIITLETKTKVKVKLGGNDED